MIDVQQGPWEFASPRRLKPRRGPLPLRGTLSSEQGLTLPYLSFGITSEINGQPLLKTQTTSGRTGIVSWGRSNLLSTGGSFFASAEGVEELEEKEMEKNMGKAFYFILNLKNYRNILQP
jgi:hypothetical protein